MALLGGSLAYTPQDAHAASEWSDILKPLVKDVLIPGAKLGVKKMSERHARHKDEQVIEVNQVEIPQPPSDWQQEPPPPPEWNTSSQEGGNEADVTVPTPDGPISVQTEEPMAQASDAFGGAEPPPPPPPPIE
ncbi:MAG TPA: hypothetical protein V6C52_12275 [Coleofasciculaceae cyanobacterium]